MLYVVDFDGTLSTSDSVDALLEKFAAPEWKLVEQQWLEGQITATACMRQQIDMVAADRIAIETFFRAIQLDRHFLSFYRHVSASAMVAIVSDGLDHAAQVATRHANFPEIPIYSNRLHFKPDGISISYPHFNPACEGGNGVCKCSVARDLCATHPGPVILIGDGKSDACIANRADVVFAKGSLISFCQREGIEHIPFSDFADVLAVVRTWPAHQQQSAV